MSSTKAIHGHLLGAGGAVELLATLRALAAGSVPVNANTREANAAFRLDLVCGETRTVAGLRHAMSSSFAFGGTNAVLVASRA